MVNDDEEVFDEVRETIVSLKLSLKAIVDDIVKHDGDEEELKELNHAGTTSFRKLKEALDEFRVYISVELDEVMKKRLKEELMEEHEQVHRLLREFQKAYIKRTLSLDKKLKNELFALANPEEMLRRRQTSNASNMLQQNTEVTNHMSSISRQLADVVQMNTTTLDTLVKSSASVSGIGEELKTTGSAIDQSAKLLTKYSRREVTDQFLFIFAFLFFVACVCYVIYCRMG